MLDGFPMRLFISLLCSDVEITAQDDMYLRHHT